MLNNIIKIFIFISVIFFFSCKSDQDLSQFNFLEIPFICVDPCKRLTKEGISSTLVKGSSLLLIFSGKNSENSFFGYNIWYGDGDKIRQAHQQKNFNYVISSKITKGDILTFDAKNVGRGDYPTIYTSKSSTEVSYFVIKIDNVESGKSVYITASSSTGDSQLSNEFKIP